MATELHVEREPSAIPIPRPVCYDHTMQSALDPHFTPRLQQRWDELLTRSQVAPARGQATFADLCAAYAQPQRHYHTLTHLDHMLGLLYDSGNTQPAALWATWYHDYVYRPGRSDNEQRSAEIAGSTLQELQVAEPTVRRTQQIILATQSHRYAGDDPVLQGVLDADMAILGVAPDRYREYCGNVRLEFSLTPRLLFNRGRRSFIETVLAQPRIFTTEWFFERFENQARDNLRTELLEL